MRTPSCATFGLVAVGTLDGEVIQTRNEEQNADLDDDSGDDSGV